MLINQKIFCATIIVVEWVIANIERVQGNNNNKLDQFKLNSLYVQTQRFLRLLWQN